MDNFDSYKDLLSEFVAFKSVSTDGAFGGEIKECVLWLKGLFEVSGFEVRVLQGPSSNPVIFASYKVSDAVETVLVYGHYDVQPAKREDGWNSEPFVLTERDGSFFARGVVDNKGQVLIHIVTVLNLIREGKLKHNIKFLIEGNEETSNEDLGRLILENKNELACDTVLISDGELVDGHPVIEYALRGGFNLTLRLTTARNNLHSGLYGGGVPNAAFELAGFLSKLLDAKNMVTVSGFYGGVDGITCEQKKNNEKIITEEKVLELAGVKTLMCEEGVDFFSQTGLRPTIQVTGIKAGYIGDGYANIVPGVAEARINFRTVKSQDEFEVLEAFKKFAAENIPGYVDYEISHTEPYKSVKIDVGQPKFKKVKSLLRKAFSDEVLIKPVGGGIPVVSDFKEILGKDCLLVSLGNDDCNMHGANENFKISLIKKGLKFSELFFGK